jgi:hypothetical protein
MSSLSPHFIKPRFDLWTDLPSFFGKVFGVALADAHLPTLIRWPR